MSSVGAYIGNEIAAMDKMESWLGRDLDWVTVHTGKANWWDWESSISYLGKKFIDGLDGGTKINWSVPIFADGSNLKDAALGQYNSHYVTAAKALLALNPGSDPIYVRTGEEFNASWMTWSALGGKASDFAGAFRQMASTFKGISDRFKFEWNVNIGDFGMNPADAYPGDAYVDVIGMDFYYSPRWQPMGAAGAWDWMLNQKYGLKWFEDFAKAHGKPTAYSEWGVEGDGAGPYLQKAYEWFNSHNVVYQNYWNSNAGGFAGQMDSGQYPNAAAAFKNLVGQAPVNQPILPVAPVQPTIPTEVAPPATSNGGVVTAATNYTLGSADANLTLTGTGAINGVGNLLNNVIQGNAADNTLTGLGGDDTLKGGDGSDKLLGGDGDDILSGDTGSWDMLDGGAGSDTASYASAMWGVTVDLSITGAQNTIGGWTDTLVSIENLVGSNYNDVLKGNAEDNILFGGAGDDTLTGGGGKDTFRFAPGGGKDVITDFSKGGDAIDIAAYLKAGQAPTLSDTAQGAVLKFQNGDTIQVQGVLASDLQKTASGYVFAGTSIPSTSLPASDPVAPTTPTAPAPPAGSSGGVISSAVNYTLPATVADLILTGAGHTTGTGNATANVIQGNAGDNTLNGLQGADTLKGGDGSDKLFGGDGDDVLNGGVGSWDFLDGGAGSDTASYDDAAWAVTVDLAVTGAQNTGGAWTDTLVSIENLTGSAFADILRGNAGDNTLRGGGGDDKLYGGSGADKLDGQAGADYMEGGAGADTFMFGRGGGRDVVADFGAGGEHDVLDISAWKAAGFAPTLSSSSAGTMVTFATGDSIQLLGVHSSQLHVSDVGFYI